MIFSTLRIAWRNLGRHRRRTGLCLAAIAIGQFGYLTMCGLYHGMSAAVLDVVTGPMSGHVQVHAHEWREERAVDLVVEDIQSALSEIRSRESVGRAAGRIYSPVLSALDETGFQSMVVGIDPEVESDPKGLLPGLAEDVLPGHGRVLVGYILARKLGVKGGEEVAVVGQGADGSMANGLFTVSSVIRTPLDLVNRLGIVMSMADAQELFAMPDQAHEIVVYASEPGTSTEVAAELRSLETLAASEVMGWREVSPQLADYISMVDKAGAIMLALVLLAAAAGVANTMMMSTFERQHEFGMLLSLGCRPRKIVWMIMVEAVVLGLAGVVVGTTLGAALVTTLGHTGMDMMMGGGSGTAITIYALEFPTIVYPRFAVGDAVNGTLAVSFTAVLASLWPASYAARLEPSSALRA
jgi:ABC-type lipoprotein release transport system permease subunit